jgi:hypothetical protein
MCSPIQHTSIYKPHLHSPYPNRPPPLTFPLQKSNQLVPCSWSAMLFIPFLYRFITSGQRKAILTLVLASQIKTFFVPL